MHNQLDFKDTIEKPKTKSAVSNSEVMQENCECVLSVLCIHVAMSSLHRKFSCLCSHGAYVRAQKHVLTHKGPKLSSNMTLCFRNASGSHLHEQVLNIIHVP